LVVLNPKDGSEEEVTLTPGFAPLALASFNNIAYIISFNKTTGESEIGTYPSPNWYAILHNLDEVACTVSVSKVVIDQTGGGSET
jgi:hypothetical protein